MDISKVIHLYLADDPSAWRTIVDSLCYEVSSLASRFRDPGGDDNVEQLLVDLLFPELLAPDFVSHLANTSERASTENTVARRIWDLMSATPVVSTSEDEDGWFHTFDRNSDYSDSDEASLLPEGFSILEPLEEKIIRRLVSDVFNAVDLLDDTPDAAEKKALTEVFRLDIVDAALYKALLTHPELLRSIDWRAFERLLADILASFGFEIELQRGTKDGGIDLFAVKRTDLIGPHRYLLQAKRWSNKVGIEPVRQLAFLHAHHRMTKSCLATTSTFTAGARDLARQYQWQLELRDFVGVHEWIKAVAGTKIGI